MSLFTSCCLKNEKTSLTRAHVVPRFEQNEAIHETFWCAPEFLTKSGRMDVNHTQGADNELNRPLYHQRISIGNLRCIGCVLIPQSNQHRIGQFVDHATKRDLSPLPWCGRYLTLQPWSAHVKMRVACTFVQDSPWTISSTCGLFSLSLKHCLTGSLEQNRTITLCAV